MKRRESKHWSHAYLRRINSTEVTVRKERRQKVAKQKEPTLPLVSYREEQEEVPPKSQHLVIQTPVRKVEFLTPRRCLTIPMTPENKERHESTPTRTKRRLFW